MKVKIINNYTPNIVNDGGLWTNGRYMLPAGYEFEAFYYDESKQFVCGKIDLLKLGGNTNPLYESWYETCFHAKDVQILESSGNILEDANIQNFPYDPTKKCSTGYHREGNLCVKDVFIAGYGCQKGYHAVGSYCVEDIYPEDNGYLSPYNLNLNAHNAKQEVIVSGKMPENTVVTHGEIVIGNAETATSEQIKDYGVTTDTLLNEEVTPLDVTVPATTTKTVTVMGMSIPKVALYVIIAGAAFLVIRKLFKNKTK